MDANVDYGFDDTNQFTDNGFLSYDDTTTYEEQVSALPDEPMESTSAMSSNGNGLAGRISTNKLYLLSESTSAARGRSSKVRHYGRGFFQTCADAYLT